MKITSDHKRAATRIGVSPEEYARRLKCGMLWCWACRKFQDKGEFGKDKGRTSGRAACCKSARAKKGK